MQRFRVRVGAVFMYMQKRVKMFIFPIKRGDVKKKKTLPSTLLSLRCDNSVTFSFLCSNTGSS